MSLTNAFHVFASIDEQGTNRALQAFFGARPHYLHYGSVPFVSASSASVTQVSTIAFPGIPGGIPYAIDLTVPVVDLFPPDGALPPPLVLGPDQLSITTKVTITLGCTAGSDDTDKRGHVTPVRTTLDVIAIANPVSHYFSPGVGFVSFQVDQVLVPDVAPPSLQAVLDCLLEMILNALLAGVQLPFDIIDADFVKLALEAGPTIADDQIKIWGDVS
jgi:hypothetical protein